MDNVGIGDINGMCSHSKLTEVDDITAMNIDIEGQKGNLTGMFHWKKYTCDVCKRLVTVLQAVVEDVETK